MLSGGIDVDIVVGTCVLHVPVLGDHLRATGRAVLRCSNLLPQNLRRDEASRLTHAFRAICLIHRRVHLKPQLIARFAETTYRVPDRTVDRPRVSRAGKALLAAIERAGLLTVGLQDRFVNNANKGLDLENRAYYMYVAYNHS
jgi:hypothetical protein